MSYIGNVPTQAAFVTDTFSGNGSTTAFTMSVAPAGTSSALVVVSGVLQDPSTYSVNGLTLTFSAAPPTGTGNISVRYLGIPASGVTTTAYRTVTEFTATAAQTTFTPPSYTVGFINVYRNGVRLGASDYTATNGTTVVLASGATSGDLVTIESFLVSSVLNGIPATNGSVSLSGPYISGVLPYPNLPTGSVLQVVSAVISTGFSTTSTTLQLSPVTLSITPKSATSKILIMANCSMYIAENGRGAPYYYGRASVARGSSQLLEGRFNINTGSTAITDGGTTLPITYLDSPATASSVTYNVYISSLNDSFATYISQNAPSSITLMEIAG